ncbi:MAG: hypothetical protein V2A64_01655 [Candidatus Omnitrophota bacterium]
MTSYQTNNILPGRIFLNSAYAQEASNNIRTLLSTEGKVLYGNEPNSIVVIDYPENIQRVADFLDVLDTPPEQVLIEARVVEVKLQKEHSLGVNWQVFADKGYMPMGRFKAGSSALGLQPGLLEQAIGYKTTYSPPSQSATSPIGAESPFTFAIFDDNISLVLRTLATSLDTDILSAPRVTTVNNHEAEIKVVQSLPYSIPTLSVDEGVTTIVWSEPTFVEVGITLKVTPMINDDGKITMSLEPEVSEKISDYLLTATVGTESIDYSIPIIDKRNATTKVIIGNGQTLIIGGLIKDKTTKNISKIPLLGDIPYLGHLFKSEKNVKDKTELLIFVSPTIITPDQFVSMAKQERYGAGKRFVQDRRREEQISAALEDKEQTAKEKLAVRLDLLEKKQNALAARRKELETDVFEARKDLNNLDKANKEIVNKRKDLENIKAR